MYKLFVLGLPGSGKSTVSHAIIRYVKQKYKNWSVDRICDYGILYNMFRADVKRKDFYPVKYGGFYVTNPAKYDFALHQLEKEVETFRSTKHKLIVIEFSRGNYLDAFKIFDEGFLSNSSFLYLHTGINSCLARVAQRVENPQCIDDHFVPERTFDRFNGKDTEEYARNVNIGILKSYEGKYSRFRIIDSSGTLQDTIVQSTSFVDEIIQLGSKIRFWEAGFDMISTLPHTGPLEKNREDICALSSSSRDIEEAKDTLQYLSIKR
jgi:adenylate kinase family enzyme